MKKLFLPLFLTALFLATPAHAGGGATGGSTEITQLLNNVELIGHTGYLADQVATQIEQYVLQQFQAELQKFNLQPLAGTILPNLSPWQQQGIQPYVKAYDVTTKLRDSANTASQMLSGEVAAMQKLQMDPQTYTQTMIQASKDQSGYYKKAVDDDIKALQDLQARGEALNKLRDEIPSIDTQIKGMQSLATTNTMMVGEVQNMNQNLLQMKQDMARREQLQAAADQRANQALSQHQADLQKRREADKKFWQK